MYTGKETQSVIEKNGGKGKSRKENSKSSETKDYKKRRNGIGLRHVMVIGSSRAGVRETAQKPKARLVQADKKVPNRQRSRLKSQKRFRLPPLPPAASGRRLPLDLRPRRRQI